MSSISRRQPREAPARRKGIYLLPNLLTTGALFGGFYAVLSGFSGNYEWAAMAIFAAMLFDGLDGRVARMTNTQSDFGVQYDSLSDMVSFGVAPAVVAYGWGVERSRQAGIWPQLCLCVLCARCVWHVLMCRQRWPTRKPLPVAQSCGGGVGGRALSGLPTMNRAPGTVGDWRHLLLRCRSVDGVQLLNTQL